MHDRGLAGRHRVAGEERIGCVRRVEQEAAVLVELRELAPLGHRREHGRRDVGRVRQGRLRRQRERGRRPLERAAVDPGRDRGLLIGGERHVVLEGLAAAVVDHEVGRHRAGGGPLLFEPGVRLRVGIVVEAEGPDPALLVAAHALRVVDGRHVLPERDRARRGLRAAATTAGGRTEGQHEHDRDHADTDHEGAPFSIFSDDRTAPGPSQLPPTNTGALGMCHFRPVRP